MQIYNLETNCGMELSFSKYYLGQVVKDCALQVLDLNPTCILLLTFLSEYFFVYFWKLQN